MVKSILLFTSLVLILASSYAMKCYDGTNFGCFPKTKIKNGCDSCPSINSGKHTHAYVCSLFNCSLSTKFTTMEFNCCMDKDLCNSAVGLGPWFLIKTMLVLVAYFLSRN
ncbi:hypothetical protein LSH36_661g00033 [Paralvinella palmiformis]|uniref:Uncharacterized protein n=1 Tax=Paralvinella palmiformis TaxID=53620 RepID=A0AAD9MTY8_9ANNE|nr:hypothetical protein LSH36_661g00033 [Paralvinella palmiformis]